MAPSLVSMWHNLTLALRLPTHASCQILRFCSQPEAAGPAGFLASPRSHSSSSSAEGARTGATGAARRTGFNITLEGPFELEIVRGVMSSCDS